MIPDDVREEISQYLGSEPKPYLISLPNGNTDSSCIFWKLPTLRDEDKPLDQRYNEITMRLAQLFQKDKTNPEIDILKKEAEELLKGIHVTKRFGFSMLSTNDLLIRDKKKGIRKEWWELHSKYLNRGVLVFLGNNHDVLIAMPNANQYEFLRINRTKGNNHSIETDRIIESIKKIDNEYGVVIISAFSDFLEFIFKKSIESKSRARIRQRLYRLCPNAEELTASIRLGRVSLWWD